LLNKIEQNILFASALFRALYYGNSYEE